MHKLKYLLLPLIVLSLGNQSNIVSAEELTSESTDVAEVITSTGKKTTYTSLVDAFKAVSNKCTVNLLKDVYVGSEDTKASRLVVNTKGYTVNFDFNGHEIIYNGTKENNDNFMGIFLQNVTFKVYATNGGGMRKLSQDNEGSFYCFHLSGPTVYTNGRLEIYEGNFVGYPTAVNVQKGVATIYGGNFESGIAETGFVLNCNDSTAGKSAKINVSGGNFKDFDPGNHHADLTSYLTDGYSSYSYENDSSMFRVLPTFNISYIDGNYSTDLGMRLLLNKNVISTYNELGYTFSLKTKKELYEGNTVSGYEEGLAELLNYQSVVNEVEYEVAGFNGIKFYEMTSKINVSLTITDNEGVSLVTDTINFSYASYAKKAMTQYAGQEDKASKIEIIKQLLVLGGLSQTDNNYHTDDLASSYVE